MTDKHILIVNGVVANIIKGASDGYIPATGDLADAQIGDVVKNGKIIPPKDTRTHGEKRASEYPKIGDQLDALWHAMDKGILPKVDDFYTPIKTVKDKYPKPKKNN